MWGCLSAIASTRFFQSQAQRYAEKQTIKETIPNIFPKVLTFFARECGEAQARSTLKQKRLYRHGVGRRVWTVSQPSLVYLTYRLNWADWFTWENWRKRQLGGAFLGSEQIPKAGLGHLNLICWVYGTTYALGRCRRQQSHQPAIVKHNCWMCLEKERSKRAQTTVIPGWLWACPRLYYWGTKSEA